MAAAPAEAVLLLYCMGQAIMIGALASAEERHHGTHDWQLLQPTPAWQQWMVKVGVTLGLALLLGAALPLLLLQLGPHEGVNAIGDLTVLIVLVTAGSVYISSLSSSGVQALAWSVPVGMAIVLFIQTIISAMRSVNLQPFGDVMAEIATGEVRLRAVLLALTLLLLWFGFVNHTSSPRTARRLFQQVAAIALVILAATIVVGGDRVFYELRTR
jgi:hypothetical protein